MAAFNWFDIAVEDLGNAVHNFSSHNCYAALTNSAPVASNTLLANITQIAQTNGYTTDGKVCSLSSWSQTSGTAKLILADPSAWTATGGAMPDFRYVVLYNKGATAKTNPLLGWWDYGSTVSLAQNETFTLDLDGTNGVLQLVKA